MSLRLMLCAISAFVFQVTTVSTSFAATHQDVTPYEDLQTRLTLEPGQTFLAFMIKEVKPGLDAFEKTIQNDPATKARNYRQLQANLIKKGAGVAIRIDRDNYIFNIGYLDGSSPKDDVKSGRSYGVGPRGTESDPSDVAYLKELEAYLRAEPAAAGDFVEALMKVITNCDSSGWARLSEDGQSVATDFLAIYTAELDRHLMVGLAPRAHPWEIDLAAATFVSVFDVETGLIMKNGELVKGSLTQWWAQGQVGSGIGETRRDRIALSALLGREQAGTAEARELAGLIGDKAGDDVIQDALLYLNSKKAPADMSRGEGEQLTRAMREFLVSVQKNARAIAASQ